VFQKLVRPEEKVKSLSKMFASVSLVVAVVIGSLGVITTETACSANTCSSAEESSCTNAYTSCVNEAAATADKAKCNSCIDTYCSCYDSCGNSCDRDKVAGSCSAM
jgi:hypothetical protein